MSLLWAGAITVLPAGTACPSGEAVAADLDRLGASAALAALGSTEVTVEDAKMRIVLRGRDGSIIGAREIAAPKACHERASVAAVFIAAWVGAWSTKLLPNLRPPNPKSATTAATTASGAERPRTKLAGRTSAGGRSRDSTPPANTPLSASTPPPGPAPLLPQSPPPEPFPLPTSSSSPSLPSPSAVVVAGPKRAPSIEVAGMAFGTHDGDAGAFGGGVSAAYRIGDTLSVAALLETTGERERTLGPVVASYRTSRLGLGVSMLRRSGRLFGDAGLLPELTMLTASGSPLVVPRTVTTWGAAVELRFRLGLALGRYVPFLFAAGSGALRAEQLKLDDRTESATLSRWDLSAGAGLAIFLGKSE